MIPWARMTLAQQLNTMCNKIANCAVIRACSNEGDEKECSWLLPMEGVAIIIGGAKMTSKVATSTRFCLGREEAWQFYTRPMRIKKGSNKGGLGWSVAAFNAVDWQAIAAALKGKPDTFGLWLSKQAIGVCATRKNLARIQGILDNRCPNCGSPHKDNKHLNRCTDPGVGCFTRMYDNLSSGSTITTRLTRNWHSGFHTTFSSEAKHLWQTSGPTCHQL
jgi:hypothetical protein